MWEDTEDLGIKSTPERMGGGGGGERKEIEVKNDERMSGEERKEGGGENERNKERTEVRALILKC